MPLGKDDAPDKVKDEPAHAATKAEIAEVLDAGAGAPPALREAAEDLPENDAVEVAIKAAMLADDAQTEAKEKAKVVDNSSTGAEDTPSGFALKKVVGISDDVKRGEEYARLKGAKRHGYVPASAKDLE